MDGGVLASRIAAASIGDIEMGDLGFAPTGIMGCVAAAAGVALPRSALTTPLRVFGAFINL
jgi:hypothetical protein